MTCNLKIHLSSVLIFGVVLSSQSQIITPGSALHKVSIDEKLISDFPIDRSILIADSAQLSLIDFSGSPSRRFQLFSQEVGVTLNSLYGRSYDDGPLWTGKGWTTYVNAGFFGSIGKFHYSFVPNLYFSQNSDFSTVDYSNHNYGYNGWSGGFNADYQQRFGDEPFVSFQPGQTSLTYKGDLVKVSLTTENQIYGPAIYNGIMMSKQGQGFPRLVIGSSEPWRIRLRNVDLGKVHGEVFWGFTRLSDHFNESELYDFEGSYLTGLTGYYQFPGESGIKVGVTRSLYTNMENFDGRDLISFLFRDKTVPENTNPDDTLTNDAYDQLASVYADWHFKPGKFRLYFEFAKNDFNGSLENLIADISHGRGIVLGFQKGLNIGGQPVVLNYEHTVLSRSNTFLYRPHGVFYMHHINRQGYTHNGQVIGAGIGPGSNGDFTSMAVYINKKHRIEGSIQRIAHNQDYFITTYDYEDMIEPNDVEWSWGLNYSLFSDLYILSVDMKQSNRLSWLYIKDNDRWNYFLNVSFKHIIGQTRTF